MTSNVKAPEVVAAIQKVRDIVAYQDACVREREVFHQAMWLGFLSDHHVAALSAPGAGKTMSMDIFSEQVHGANVFSLQLGPTMTFSSAKGMPSIKALRDEDVTRYGTDSRIWNSQLVVFDEVFRANDAFRGEALTWMEQRWLENGGAKYHTPLKAIIGASNSFPDNALDAMFDRFVLRVEVKQLSKGGRGQYARDRFGANRVQVVKPDPISLEECLLLSKVRHEVVIPDEIIDSVNNCFEECLSKGMVLSGRKFIAALEVIQLSALLDGSDVVLEDHIEVLQHMLWSKPEETAGLMTILSKYTAGYTIKGQSLVDEAYNLRQAALQDLEAQKKNGATGAAEGQVIQFHAPKLRACRDELKKLIAQAAEQGRDCTKLKAYEAKIHGYMTEVVEQAMR